jgi:hypothetical protein
MIIDILVTALFTYLIIIPAFILAKIFKIFNFHDIPIPFFVIIESFILADQTNTFEPAIGMIYSTTIILIIQIYVSYFILYLINNYALKYKHIIKITIYSLLFAPPIFFWLFIILIL